MRAEVALVTCVDLPELEDDDRLTIAPLAALNVDATPAVWSDPSVDWSRFDLVVLRSPWDYSPRRDEFVKWAHSVPRLANDATTVEWNTDKVYLRDLAAAGVPTVHTTWVAPGNTWTPPQQGAWVIKPAISAGSRDTGRYDLANTLDRGLATAHVERLSAAGRTVMIQPYLESVDTAGETGLIFFGGTYSHAIRKGPMLDGPDLDPDGRGRVEGLYKPEAISPREPSAAEHTLAATVLRALPSFIAPPLYARVDLILGADGTPVLVELELTEPSFFLEHGPGSAERFAAAVAAAI